MHILECQHCRQRWNSDKEQSLIQCPHCQMMTGRRVVAEERIERAKWAFDGAESIEEMACKLELYAQRLRLLDEEWSLREPVTDDYAFLERELTDEELTRDFVEIVSRKNQSERASREESEDIEDWF